PNISVKARYPPPQAVFFNVNLHPKQQYNLEMAMNVIQSFIQVTEKTTKQIEVLDRTTAILKIFERRATRDPACRHQVKVASLNNLKTNMWRTASWNAKRWMDDLARSLGEKKVQHCVATNQEHLGLSFTKHGRSAHAWNVCHSFTDDHRTYNYPDREAEYRTGAMKRVRDGFEKVLFRKAEERRQITKGKNVIGVVGYTNVGKSALINRLMASNGRHYDCRAVVDVGVSPDHKTARVKIHGELPP
ncbi:unnamed protein product, partial [Amoebophrya sp. A120]